MKALHELDKDEYIKHLEDIILDSDYDTARCEQCGRVECREYMTIPPHYLANSCDRICDTCLPAWERAEKKAQENAKSDEKDYQWAKGNR
jgi:hypothetical protein